MARLNTIAGALGRRLRPSRRRPLFYLHVAKCAGTQIKLIGEQINARSRTWHFHRFGHDRTLDHVPEGAAWFFSIRDPISRFRSGFYSRKREGRPRHVAPHRPGERLAFERFEHANDLAEALFAQGGRGEDALKAMTSIAHANRPLHRTVGFWGHFLEQRPPVHILRQERFASDFAVLAERLDLDVEVTLTQDRVASHRFDYSGAPELSARAVENLNRWYAIDLEFHAMCERWIEAGGAARQPEARAEA